jgi:MarR family transcriptional regulator, 2-MHQ and catechol-resistance regulon repressor
MAGKQRQDSNGVIEAISATYRILRRESEELLSKEDMTRPQFQALMSLAQRGPILMKEISEKMFVTRANVTGIIDRLESKGLVRRTANHRDRRATMIELTPKGVALQERVSSKYTTFMQDSLKVLTEDEQKSLRDALVKLQGGMSKARK